VAVIGWTDKSYFGLRDLTIQGNTGHGVHVVTTGANVFSPLFESIEIIGFGEASSELFFDVNSMVSVIYFPFVHG
jgi:hypothetical protein